MVSHYLIAARAAATVSILILGAVFVWSVVLPFLLGFWGQISDGLFRSDHDDV